LLHHLKFKDGIKNGKISLSRKRGKGFSSYGKQKTKQNQKIMETKSYLGLLNLKFQAPNYK
jgi:hypothetical protein